MKIDSGLGLAISLSLFTWFANANDIVERNLTLDLQGIDQLEVKAGAGSLRITGVSGAREISVDAKIRVEDMEQVRLSLEKHGNKAVLVSELEDIPVGWFSWTNNATRYIDVVVTLPEELLLTVQDGSGDTSIQNIMAAVDITDGSGSLDIDTIGADVNLKDGSGDIKIVSIKGNLRITDGSGSVKIENVKGSIEGTDGSGDFKASQISGGIRLTDGSGSLTLEDIGGSVDIDDGSGDLKLQDVVGDVVIKDGSGSIRVSNIDGRVQIHDGSGDIRVASISKGLTIEESGSGGLSMDDIQGEVDIDE